MGRALAAAEVNRDRARAGLERLEELISEKEDLGLSVEAELSHLGRLRIALASAEADLAAARRTLGQAA